MSYTIAEESAMSPLDAPRALRSYRRRLSGRGPFAKVRCAFEGMETCSAYAERAVRESPSAWIARPAPPPKRPPCPPPIPPHS
jgi:hypothetical protein